MLNAGAGLRAGWRAGHRRLTRAAGWLRRRAVARRCVRHAVPPAEIDELLRVARLSFVALQQAWDRADLRALSTLAMAPLVADFEQQLAERGPQANITEVLELNARLLSWEELTGACVASVEFSGLIRERLDDPAAPFRELWLLASVKPVTSDWKLVRVQALG